MKMLRIVLLTLTCLAMALTASDPVKLTVHVQSAINGKPIDRASVIVRFKSGIGVNLKKIQTSWETKTNQEGNVTLPKYDVTTPDVKVGSTEKQVTVPTVQTEKRTIEVPTVKVTPADEKQAKAQADAQATSKQ